MYFREKNDGLPEDGVYVIFVHAGLVAFHPAWYPVGSEKARAVLEVVDARQDSDPELRQGTAEA